MKVQPYTMQTNILHKVEQREMLIKSTSFYYYLIILTVAWNSNFKAESAKVLDTIELWNASTFTIPPNSKSPVHHLQGNFKLNSDDRLEIQIIEDRFNLMESLGKKITSLPVLEIQLITTDEFIIPIDRGVQTTEHSYWEYLLEPGQVWYLSDMWSQASMPFALSERNANCTHNGLIGFKYNTLGDIKDVRIQIATETCPYLKFNLQGNLTAKFRPNLYQNKDSIIASYLSEREHRVPISSLQQFSTDYPEIDAELLKPKDFANTSTYGLSFNNKHYQSKCFSRAGNYPYCDHFALPSYSLAKTIFAGMSFIYLDRKYKHFSTIPVTDYIPECRGKGWEKVSIKHLVNMETGHYQSPKMMVDESAVSIAPFFDSESSKDKIQFACSEYPLQENAGKTWVYHTSDHYLAGVFMTRFMRQKTGNNNYDLYRDLLRYNILSQLNLSPLLNDSKRTYDSSAQPFVGWGLTLLSDDLVKISNLLNTTAKQILVSDRLNNESTFQYDSGYWFLNLQSSNVCADKIWQPFLSGYGGITVALLPNNMNFYQFTDGYSFNWRHVLKVLNSINPVCS